MFAAAILALAGLALARPAMAVPPPIDPSVEGPVLPAFEAWKARLHPLLGTPSPADGQLRVLVLLVRPNDLQPNSDRSHNVQYWRDLMFAEGASGTSLHPFPSLAEFYRSESRGAFSLTGEVLGWIEAPREATYYSRKSGTGLNGNYGLGTGFTLSSVQAGGARAMVADALAAVTGTIDLADYDRNLDGIVDAVIVVHAGPNAENTQDRDDLWSHQFEDEFVLGNESWRVRYIVVAERFYWPAAGRDFPSGIGVIAHEFGHILGLPDLYARSGQGFGVGPYSVMSYGLYRQDGRRPDDWGPDAQPFGFDPWSMLRLDWTAPQPVTENDCRIPLAPFDVTPQVLSIPLNDAQGRERFLVSYMRDVGSFESLGAAGLMIMHEDPGLEAPINTNSCVPSPRGDSCRNSHYWLSVEQADGRFDLERGVGQIGTMADPRDVWAFGVGFGPDDDPTSCTWDAVDCRTRISARRFTVQGAEVRVVRQPDALPPAPQLTDLPPVDAVLGEPYTWTPRLRTPVEATWSLIAGPPDMTVDPDTGRIDWLPTVTGRFDVRLFVENCSGDDGVNWTIAVQRRPDEPGGCGCHTGGGNAPGPGFVTLLLAVAWWRWRRRALST